MILPLLKLSVRAIFRNKLRSFLTILGIVIGVASVIIMISVGQGARKQIENEISSLGTNLIMITPGAMSQNGVSSAQGTFSRLTIEDYELLKKEAQFISYASPVVMARTQIVGGSGNWNTSLHGVSDEYLEVRSWQVAEGYMFDQSDIRSSKKVCVIGNTIKEQLFGDSSPVGVEVRLRNVPVTIIGVLEKKGESVSGSDQDDIILVPYTTLNNRLSRRRFIGQIVCSASNKDWVESAKEEANTLMRVSQGLEEGESQGFTVRNQSEISDTATATTKILTLLLAAIASVSLIVGGIGIMNIMLVSVTERTREIGIRMAIGAREFDVLLQFLLEAIVLSLLGGILGLIIGLIGLQLIVNTMGLPASLDTNAVMMAMIFSVGIGVLFGFLPARKASRLLPINALQYQ